MISRMYGSTAMTAMNTAPGSVMRLTALPR